LYAAHEETTADVTDDASMLEARGVAVEVFVGDRSNIKVTTPEDLLIAEALLASREEGE
ncbi:MAG: 2-C-methyl-D-erythritol 4-phosphate cytidylyltransferase, partial [Chloroflexi bacterium]|nr:2-C-methyl-D-erythritol 4-phosphate cytidylyltransferase [Chloroflexota bacterium]